MASRSGGGLRPNKGKNSGVATGKPETNVATRRHREHDVASQAVVVGFHEVYRLPGAPHGAYGYRRATNIIAS